MDFVIDLNPSAFKHGVSEADIRCAFDTAVYDGMLDEGEDEDARDKYLLIGFGCGANLIEVLYNHVGDFHINVFHAMPCRNIYLNLLNPKE